MPVQIHAEEKLLVTLFIRLLLVANLILTFTNLALIVKENWNPPPTHFSNLLLLSHMFATGLNLPGAMADFNQRVVQAATLNFRQNSDYVLSSQID